MWKYGIQKAAKQMFHVCREGTGHSVKFAAPPPLPPSGPSPWQECVMLVIILKNVSTREEDTPQWV